jgi:RimJ/RimL family protein N-acetyltransferase
MKAHVMEFHTARLAFKIWQADHRRAFAELNADPEVMRHFPALQTAAQSDAAVDAWADQLQQFGWGNWAVALRDTGEFIGFIGLSVPRRTLPFTPCVEVGWRLKRSAWGHGYATEGGKACLRHGFEQLGLDEIVSFTALLNTRSVAVMQRIGMHNAGADFEHPGVPPGSPLRLHCLYRITRPEWLKQQAA